MSQIVQVLGVMSSLLGIVNFDKAAQVELETPGTYDSVTRVAVGLNNATLNNADGTSPAILAFNENKEFIGQSEKTNFHIPSGAFHDIVVRQPAGPGQQPTYLQICAHNDAVCVAYVSQTWPSGDRRGWLGDFARACGYPWYYSNIIVGMEHHKPDCAWIDQDHTNDIFTSALQIHMEDFVNHTALDPQEIAPYCKYPSMVFRKDHDYPLNKHRFYFPESARIPRSSKMKALWTSPRDGYTGWAFGPGPQKNSRRDSSPPNPSRAFTHLVSSSHDKHSAQKLCESEASRGPDFVSWSEGIFCDMKAKTHWPLCENDKVETDCYHWDTHSLVTKGERAAKNYSHVEQWD
ncbi:hypothetical protein ACLMJK_000405 [Lecanora helva]